MAQCNQPEQSFKVVCFEALFESAQEEVNHRRALILESMIVLLFIIDLVAIFALK